MIGSVVSVVTTASVVVMGVVPADEVSFELGVVAHGGGDVPEQFLAGLIFSA